MTTTKHSALTFVVPSLPDSWASAAVTSLNDTLTRAATLLVLCIAFTLAGLSPTSAGPLIYSTAERGAFLVTIDFATGETKVIGPTGQIGAHGLAASGDGTLYTVTHASDTTGKSQLARLDFATGNATPFVEKNDRPFRGLTFTPGGTLVGAGLTDGALCSFDLRTGAPTKIGELGIARGAVDLTIHPNGNMYGIDETGAIFQINPNTAKATLIVTISGFTKSAGLTFDDAGRGYVVDFVSPAPVYRIDLTTGQITGRVSTYLNFFHSTEMPRPRLEVSRQGDQLVFSWPGSFMNWGLQTTHRLGPAASWAESNIPSAVVGDKINVTNNLLGAQQFFQLNQR